MTNHQQKTYVTPTIEFKQQWRSRARERHRGGGSCPNSLVTRTVQIQEKKMRPTNFAPFTVWVREMVQILETFAVK